MRKYIVWIAASMSLIAQGGSLMAQNLPQAGQWEFKTDLQGLPFGGGEKTGTACVKAEQIAAEPEKALIEAAMTTAQQGSSSKGTTPKCTLTDLKRESGVSSWKSTCEGPRGPMQGAGSGTITQDSAQIAQNFEASTPMGKRTLKQVINGKRLGECT
jgi:hypothetical protein